MIYDCKGLDFTAIGRIVRDSGDITLTNVNGQRYIAAGASEKKVDVYGTAGNACGAYLNGAKIFVHGNAQDALGDTMNDGLIVVDGTSGDATGYAMRGGKIFVKGNGGYRIGIHMKAYKDKFPVIVVGGTVGSFLGEYQAGGIIIVLGIGNKATSCVGNFCGTGMHGGKILLRCDCPPDVPEQISVKKADEKDLLEICVYLDEFCRLFGYNRKDISGDFYILTPNTANPYKRLYTYS